MTGSQPKRLFGLTEAEILVMLDLMENWSAWLDEGGSDSGGICGSVERRYVAPRPDEEAITRGARNPLASFDAENVEAALSGLRSPSDRDFLVHRHYHKGGHFRGDARQRAEAAKWMRARFGLTEAELDRFHVRCLAELKVALAEVERIRRDKGIRVIFSDVVRFRSAHSGAV